MSDGALLARWRIEGRVQGVGYRDWMVREAASLGIAGWVRNTRDGAVEALVGGEAAAIERLRDACRRGPPLARVDRIDESAADPADRVPAQGFQRRPTA